MKYALVSSNEPREAGYRVSAVEDTSFEVAPPLFWVDCEDHIVADQFWFDPADDGIKEIPVVIIPKQAQPISQGAQTL